MTTAHRPTFDPARGKEAQRGPAYHQRLLPAYLNLKERQPGQGGSAETTAKDFRAELLKAEAAHFAKKNGTAGSEAEPSPTTAAAPKRALPDTEAVDVEDDGTSGAKRQRLDIDEAEDGDIGLEQSSDESGEESGLEESEASGEESSENDGENDEDEEDEQEELLRELNRIKQSRVAEKVREEAEKAAEAQEQREYEIATGNPLLNPKDFSIKRRWDDDVIFKNQARGTEKKKAKEFVNDMLRSEFHREFMSKFIK